MAHIINRIDILSRAEVKLRKLCCMNDINRPSVIHDSEGIHERIQKAAMVNRLLEADVFERENRIKQYAEAKHNIKK